MQQIVSLLSRIFSGNSNLFLEKIPIHIIVAASTWISRIVIAAVQIFNVRILIESLGSDSYASFIFYASLAPWFALGDLGIGPSLQNFIAEQRANKQNYNQYIYSAFMISAIIFLFLILLLYFITPYIVPYLLKNISIMAYTEKVQSFYIVSIIMIGTAFGSNIYRIWYAQQKGYLSNIIPAFASIIGFAGIWLVAKSPYSHSLIINLVAFFLPAMLLSIFAFILKVFLIPHLKFEYDSIICKKLIKRAMSFSIFAVMAAATLQIDYIIMLQFLSPDDIIIYNICMKVFGIISMLYVAVLGALSPVFTELIVCRKWDVILSYIKKYFLIGGSLIVILTMIIVMFLPSFFHFLAPREQFIVPVSFVLLLGFNQLIVFEVSIFSTILQSMSYIRIFLWITPIQMIISAVLQWKLVQLYGIYGIVFGIMVSYIVLAVWLLPYKVYEKANLSVGGK